MCILSFYIHTHSVVMGIYVGKLTPVIVVFRVTNIKETTTQKYSHTHKNHTIHYTYRHTHSHGHKRTLLTTVQLLPGTAVISHITVFINYYDQGPYTHSQQEFEINLPSTLKSVRKPQLSHLQSFSSPS